jgi:hypothetical protein
MPEFFYLMINNYFDTVENACGIYQVIELLSFFDEPYATNSCCMFALRTNKY